MADETPTLAAFIHEAARDLHEAGLLDDGAMREFDASCIGRDSVVP